VFPGGRGELRMPSAERGAIEAMWMQPGSPIDSNPYATPVVLRSEGSNKWTGTIAPFVPQYELYVTFVRNAAGTLGGFIRDPIGDFGTMAPFETVAIDADNITITTRAHVLHGSVDAMASAIVLSIGTGPPLHFYRLNPNLSNGYFPINPGEDSSFSRPPAEGDGWRTEAPSSVGMDDARLQQLARYLASQTPTAPNTPYIQSVLVAREDRLVTEHYYYGFSRTRPHDVRSAGKSLDAALFGAAMRIAPSLTVDTLAYRWLPYGEFAHPDKRKSQITVGNFFDMTSGLDCDDNNDGSSGNEDTLQSQTAQPDWYRYMMDLPMVRDPGSQSAVYCSGGMNMIGAFIIGATHRWTPELFADALARPLQFGIYHLQLTPTGEMYLGGGSYFLPRDFLKLGQVFLDDGEWNDRRVLPQAWARDAVSSHSGLNAPNDYGYAWHLTVYRTASATYDAFEAQGNGGQLLIVLPRLRLVVGIMAANYGDYRTWGKFHELVEQYIVAACQ
jgi:CubicO group peptidase (beta-lactamase class C family)